MLANNVCLFITATDTDAGKTYLTAMLLSAAMKQNIDCMGLKPIASGINSDNISDIDLLAAALLHQYSDTQINCFSFKESIAPHLAAQHEHTSIDLDIIVKRVKQYRDKQLLLVEGVGGWLVPLDENNLLPVLVKQLALPVILVVNVKTGCINHALLTMKAIRASGVELAGWIANQIDSQVDLENVQTIEYFSKIPCWAMLKQQKLLTPEIFQAQLLSQNCCTQEIDDLLAIITN